jgi:hypothetical protein
MKIIYYDLMITNSLSKFSLLIFVLGLTCNSIYSEILQNKNAVPSRIVVVGDLHADISAAKNALILAGAINENNDWIGGELVIIQLGDLIGRSYEEKQVLDFIFDIQEKSKVVGGQFHILIGNHEVFGAELELKWVHENAFASFDGMPGLDLHDHRLSHIPISKKSRSAALIAGGYYAKKFSNFPAVLKLGDTIYVHGGITPYWAKYGIDRINAEVKQWFAGEIKQPPSALGRDPGNPNDNVMMSRHFSRDVDDNDCSMLDMSLKILGAKRMIVAHSVQDVITSYCDKRAWAIDVGMSRYYSGKIQILEIINDQEISIISK